MREFVNAGMLLAGGVCAAFTGSDAEGYRYIIGSRTVDLRAEAKASQHGYLRPRRRQADHDPGLVHGPGR